MLDQSTELVDLVTLRAFRAEIGAGFDRILSYFREDGARSVTRIEDAIAHGDTAALVLPAHTLKGESFQFGARRLGDLAERIEMTARRLVESRASPEPLIADVAALRPLFSQTLKALECGALPTIVVAHPAPQHPGPGAARPVFGRRVPAAGFGRA